MSEDKRSRNQLTGNAGLYYCCYRLSQLGWNVMPTARNARGIDLVAYSEDASRLISVQVKALSKRAPVPLGVDSSRCMGHFWIVVTGVATSTPKSYVLKPAEVKRLAHRGEKDGRVSYWLQPAAYDQAKYRDAWQRIGAGFATAIGAQ